MKKCLSEKGYFRQAELVILHTLNKKDCYGYEIIKILEKKSDRELILKEPTLYSILKRLEKEGYITSYWGDETNGGRRKYYSLTTEGKHHYKEMIQHWEYTKKLNDKLLK